jgi:NAD(P)-dependent dehydrogenase (short-subunit alcohol dehydrogenase family)
MSKLTGKVVLVIGAGKGIGRSICRLFAMQDATIAAVDITPINLDETAASIQEAGGSIRTYVVDITRKMPVQGLLNQVLDDLGRIDILVNCAEVEPEKSLLEMDEWDWGRTLDVNLTGAFLLTQSVARIMKEIKTGAQSGIILHAGQRAKGINNRSAYLVSKSGLETFVQQAKKEFAPFGVRVHLFHTVEEALEVCTA